MTDTAPLQRVIEVTIPAATAGTGQTIVIDSVPYAGVVSAVSFIPVSTITGQATNYRTAVVNNKGQDGSATVTVASVAFSSGSVVHYGSDENSVGLSGTAANLVVAAGDVLVWVESVTGTGLAQPGGKVRVTLDRS